jgi:hypothetical protein
MISPFINIRDTTVPIVRMLVADELGKDMEKKTGLAYSKLPS